MKKRPLRLESLEFRLMLSLSSGTELEWGFLNGVEGNSENMYVATETVAESLLVGESSVTNGTDGNASGIGNANGVQKTDGEGLGVVLKEGTLDISEPIVTMATTSQGTLPVPQYFSATGQDATSVLLTWARSSEVDRYRLEYSVRGTNEWRQIGGTFANGSVFFHFGLEPDTIYDYRLCAIYGTEYSNYAIVSAKTLSSVPIAPTEFVVTQVSADQLTIAWSGDRYAEYYRLEYAVGESTEYTVLADQITESQYVHTGLTSQTLYRYRLIAVNTRGDSSPVTLETQTTPVYPKPESPQNFVVTEMGTTRLRLKWDAVEFAVEYRIAYAVSAQSEVWIPISQSILEPTIRLTGLEPDTTYYFRLTAVGISEDSEPVTLSARTDPTPPDAPTGFSVVTTDTDTLELSWDATPGAIGYRLMWSVDGVTWNSIGGDLTATRYLHTRLTEGVTYFYRLKAFNDVGFSEPATAEGLTLIREIGIPTGFRASQINASQIRLVWDAQSDVTGYRLEYSLNGESWSYLSESNTTEFLHTGLTSDTLYQYRLMALCGERASESVAIQVQTPSVPPATPSGFEVSIQNVQDPLTGENRLEANLTWNMASDAEAYRLEYSLCGQPDQWIELPLSEPDATSGVHSGILSGTTYYYRLSAIHGTSVSAYATQTLRVVVFLDAPTNVTAVAQGDSQIVLSWNPVENATRYEVEWFDNGSWKTLQTVVETTLIHLELTPETTYWYRVTAQDDQNISSAVTCSATTMAKLWVPLATPENFTAIATVVEVPEGSATTSVRLTWNGVNQAVAYRVFESLDGLTWTSLGSTAETSFVRTDRASQTTYHYQLIAIGKEYVSEPVTLSVETPSIPEPPIAPPPVEPELPEPTSGFEVTFSDSRSLQLSWNSVTEATGYRIETSRDRKAWSVLVQLDSTETTYATRYSSSSVHYRIVTLGAEGLESEPVEMGVTPFAPVVSGLTSSATQIQLRWNRAAGADAYWVYRTSSNDDGYGENDSSVYELLTSSPISSTSYTDKGIMAGTGYRYRIVALNRSSGRTSEPVTSKSITTPLTAPSQVKLVAQAQGVTLSWNVDEASLLASLGSDAYHYVVRRTVDGSIVEIPLSSTDLTAVYGRGGVQTGWAYTDNGSDLAASRLPDNSQIAYNLWVATDMATSSRLRQELKITTAAGVPSELSVTNVGEQSITLRWTAPEGGAPGYQVQRRTYNADGTPQVQNGERVWKALRTVSGTTYTDTSAKAGTKYEYRVVSYTQRTRTASVPTNEIAVLTPPAKPGSLRADTKSLTATSVTLSWTVPIANGTYHFRLLRDEGDGFVELDEQTYTLSVSGKNWFVTAIDTTVSPNQSYRYQVQASLTERVEEEPWAWSAGSSVVRVKTPIAED